jgi:flavin-dependent dehydrogenase
MQPDTSADSFEVLVSGGGPAGASLAIRLAQLGRRVALVQKDRRADHSLVQNLSLAIQPLLEILGVESPVVLPARPARIWWGGEEKPFDPGNANSAIVDRARFDRALLDRARTAGVRIFQPARIVQSRCDGIWRIRLNTGIDLNARFLADACGRTAPNRRKFPFGARTLAMHANWAGAPRAALETIVEAGESQWYWGAPAPGGGYGAFVFTDAAQARRRNYIEFIRQSCLLSPLLAGATPGGVRVCDATALLDSGPVTRNSILVGDAVLAIDPLSSQGVQTAIGTALHAAAVIHTILDRPEGAALAMQFYRRRLRDSARFHAQAAASFYAEQYAVMDTPFWRSRAATPIAPRITASVPISPTTSIRPSANVRVVQTGAVQGAYIVAEEAMELDGRLSVYFGGIRVAPLLGSVDRPIPAAELVRQWSLHIPPQQSLRMLEWACGEGLLLAGPL